MVPGILPYVYYPSYQCILHLVNIRQIDEPTDDLGGFSFCTDYRPRDAKRDGLPCLLVKLVGDELVVRVFAPLWTVLLFCVGVALADWPRNPVAVLRELSSSGRVSNIYPKWIVYTNIGWDNVPS